MLTLSVLAVVCLASTTLAASVLTKPYYELEDADLLFENFVKQYKKTYNRIEYSGRLEIFKETLKDINSRNAKYPGTVFKVNHFADLTVEERRQYRGLKPLNASMPKVTIPDSGVAAPDALDWRDKGVVTHVKHQDMCGSCFIFSAIGNIEGQYAIKHQQCLAFSEGQALDCTPHGSCGGGWPDYIMQDLAQRAGVEQEQDYPYSPPKSSCIEDSSKVVAHVQGGAQINIPDEEVLKQKLADIGPLAVALNADDMCGYSGGILHPDLCTGQPVDHAVLLVGYGTDTDGTMFWIIKNSWNTSWGEKGYLRLLRGVNACQMGTSYTATSTVA